MLHYNSSPPWDSRGLFGGVFMFGNKITASKYADACVVTPPFGCFLRLKIKRRTKIRIRIRITLSALSQNKVSKCFTENEIVIIINKKIDKRH